MVSEENVVSLVMKSDYLSSFELRLMRKQTGKQSANSMSQTCAEIIEDDFWLVRGRSTMTLDKKGIMQEG